MAINKEDEMVIAAVIRLFIVVLYHITYTRLIRRNIFYIVVTSLFALGFDCDIFLLMTFLILFKLVS